MIRRTHHQENTQKLKKAYREELKKKTARLLVEKTDGTFEVITGVSLEELESTTHNLQEQYGVGSIGLLYRRDTYAFL